MPSYHTLEVIFKSDKIYFPKGYLFTKSPVHKKREVAKSEVSEINLNTAPPSFVYNDTEVIFVKDEAMDQLKEFGLTHNIPIVDRFDIWEHLNRPYLDTEFEPEDKQESLRQLEENGINNEEVKLIRRKIRYTMIANYFVWEWMYLGLFHYLYWTFLTKKKYRWAMEISLRNYPSKSSSKSKQTILEP
jgi:hypothetical protein